jgi:hypothetical protein
VDKDQYQNSTSLLKTGEGDCALGSPGRWKQVTRFCEHGNESLGFITGGKFDS